MGTLEELILKNLSFYDLLTIEDLLFAFDQDILEENRDLTIDDLKLELKRLIKQKRVVQEVLNGREYYKKQFQSRSAKRKIFSFLKIKKGDHENRD